MGYTPMLEVLLGLVVGGLSGIRYGFQVAADVGMGVGALVTTGSVRGVLPTALGTLENSAMILHGGTVGLQVALGVCSIYA